MKPSKHVSRAERRDTITSIQRDERLAEILTRLSARTGRGARSHAEHTDNASIHAHLTSPARRTGKGTRTSR